MGYKGNIEHLPEFVGTETWVRALESMGACDGSPTARSGDPADQTWHDFREVDVVLCLRKSTEQEFGRKKPATKLIANVAGGVHPHRALRTRLPRVAAARRRRLVCDDVEAVLDVLTLRADPGSSGRQS